MKSLRHELFIKNTKEPAVAYDLIKIIYNI